jgi:hypothetical protein
VSGQSWGQAPCTMRCAAGSISMAAMDGMLS